MYIMSVIAVGITNFKDDMIGSGVLDFCVPMGQYERMEEGLGAAAGVMAGLLWKIKQSSKLIGLFCLFHLYLLYLFNLFLFSGAIL